MRFYLAEIPSHPYDKDEDAGSASLLESEKEISNLLNTLASLVLPEEEKGWHKQPIREENPFAYTLFDALVVFDVEVFAAQDSYYIQQAVRLVLITWRTRQRNQNSPFGNEQKLSPLRHPQASDILL